jgi:hypothetical protein
MGENKCRNPTTAQQGLELHHPRWNRSDERISFLDLDHQNLEALAAQLVKQQATRIEQGSTAMISRDV